MEWADIDTKRATLHVQRSVYGEHVTSPKGGRSRRVPMTERLAEALRAHRHLRGSRVLCHEDGTPVGKKALEDWMEKATRKAGLPDSRGLHALRHTFCSHLAMQGAPARAIQELAGHANLTTTTRYMHPSPAVRDAAVRLLDRRPTGDGATGGAWHQAGTSGSAEAELQ
jgi:integrase